MGIARAALLASRASVSGVPGPLRTAGRSGGEPARRQRRPKTAQLETVQPWNRARPQKHERPCGLVAPWPSDCAACFAVRPGALPRKRPAVRCGRADPYLRPARMAGDPTRAGSQSNRRRTKRRSRCVHSWLRSSGSASGAYGRRRFWSRPSAMRDSPVRLPGRPANRSRPEYAEETGMSTGRGSVRASMHALKRAARFNTRARGPAAPRRWEEGGCPARHG